MCGIAGIVHADASRPTDEVALRRMIHAVRHRGPDATRIDARPGVGLAHARLSVIDPEGGAQPMTRGGRTIVYNGEVYNFRDLRAELEALGHAFTTRSDTEVVLEGFDRWGDALFPKLVGMFALAIWDEHAQTLTLARDRVGQKPLYVSERPDGSIAFGSECSCLRAIGIRGVDPHAMATHLAHGYILGARSITPGVRRLDAGTVATWTRGSGLTESRYWSIAGAWRDAPAPPGDDAEIEERFTDLLASAVRDRLVADVPLGAFLSGGIDSGTICALMARAQVSPETYSIGFTHESYSELPGARRAAAHLGTDHHELVVEPDSPDALVSIARALDEPFADTSIIPTHALCGFARGSVTVALSGDGGDELLAGYITHRADTIRSKIGWMPRALIRALRAAAAWAPDDPRKLSAVFKAKQFLAAADLPPHDAHASWRRIGPARDIAALMGPAPDAWDPLGAFRASWARTEGLSPLSRMLAMDYETWLADDINFKADRASMAHGLEVRCPFLDHRLIEFCAPLPDRLKREGREGKVLLRRVARKLLPPGALDRPKSGFNAPVGAWMRGPWRGLITDLLETNTSPAWDTLDRRAATRLFSEHLSGRRDRAYQLFAVLMLMLWLDEHGGT